MLSEVSEKQNINKKLRHFSHNISLLLPTVTIKDEEKRGNNFLTQKILSNEYSGLDIIINDLNSFKNNLKKMEAMHSVLWKNELSLDTKTLLEEHLKHHNALNELYNKQKGIFLQLSSLFIRLTKSSVKKR